MSCAKKTDLTEMMLGMWTHRGPRNGVFDGDLDPPWKGTFLKDFP